MPQQITKRRQRIRRRVHLGALPDDLYAYATPGRATPNRRRDKHELSSWTVTDDWPELVPVTDAEVDVFEAWFGDIFDELFGPCQ